ncbi:HD domain-containing protein [Cohnella yongneupensis]|uniref:HD domain-containing protein n=1 Tax=Cohnella yongneupensis TaxID=425006 RepID=A0ABW0R880_9BACL
MTLIDRAIEFAAHAHRKQTRKGTKIPYVSHPYAVGMILQRAGCKEQVVAAGILHDTLEDTDTSSEQLLKKFGPVVLEIVEGCSEPDKSATWEERKQHTLDYLRDASLPIRMVACADKLHNIRSIKRDLDKHGPETWSRFKRGRDQQLWYYTGLIESLGYASRFPLLDDLQDEVAEAFEIELDSQDWKSLRKNKKFLAAAFETVDGNPDVLQAKMQYFKRVKGACELMTMVHECAYPVSPEYEEPYNRLTEYFRKRELLLSDGNEELDKTIGFCAVLMQSLNMYPSEVYHYLAARKSPS